MLETCDAMTHMWLSPYLWVLVWWRGSLQPQGHWATHCSQGPPQWHWTQLYAPHISLVSGLDPLVSGKQQDQITSQLLSIIPAFFRLLLNMNSAYDIRFWKARHNSSKIQNKKSCFPARSSFCVIWQSFQCILSRLYCFVVLKSPKIYMWKNQQQQLLPITIRQIPSIIHCPC